MENNEDYTVPDPPVVIKNDQDEGVENPVVNKAEVVEVNEVEEAQTQGIEVQQGEEDLQGQQQEAPEQQQEAPEQLEEFGELEQDRIESRLPLKRKRRSTIVDILAQEVRMDSHILRIQVLNPVQQQDRLTKWTEYSVRTHWANGNESEVQRRYKHFAWLRNQLLPNRGILIPPLPEKDYLNRFDEFFVEKRRRRLQQFLNRCVTDSVLQEDGSLKLFLVGTEAQFARVLKGDILQVSQKGHQLYESYRVIKQKLKHQIAAGRTPDVDEVKVASLRGLGVQMEDSCANICKGLGNLDTLGGKLSETFDAIGDNANILAQYATEILNEHTTVDCEPLGELLSKLITVSKQLALVKEHSDRSFLAELSDDAPHLFLRDMFDDISRYGIAIQELCSGRHAAFVQLETERSTLISRQDSLAGLKGSTSKYVFRKDSRIAKLTEQIDDSIRLVNEWESELERVTALTYTAAENYAESLEPTIREGMTTFADLQIENLEKQLELWKTFRETI